MKYIYVSGPYTQGDVAVNVRNAMLAGLTLMDMGYAVFIPHLTHWLHLIDPHEYEFWLDQDLAWLRKCDAVLRLPGCSPGADDEVAFAEHRDIPVAHSVAEVQALFGPGG